jgi:hypothetical protein
VCQPARLHADSRLILSPRIEILSDRITASPPARATAGRTASVTRWGRSVTAPTVLA